jgi:Glycosyltransferase 61
MHVTRARGAANRVLASTRLVFGGIANYERTVASFDAVPGAVVRPAAPLDAAPRFAVPRTVQPTPHEQFADIVNEALPKRVVRAVEIPRGRLIDDGGAVVLPDGSLVLESLWDEEHYRRDYSSPKKVLSPIELTGTYASLISLWGDNYYHWLLDSLSRLAVLEATGYGELPLIVPERLRPWQRETLSRLGVAASRLTPFRGSHVQPERLVWAAPPGYISFANPIVVRWLRERLAGSAVREPQRRLFIRRMVNRRVANESAVLGVLSTYGFEVVELESLTVAEQIELFSDARAVVGVHGAGLANILFATRPAVLELFQPGFFNASYFTLAGAGDCDYWYLTCEAAHSARGGGSSKASDIVVPIEALEQTIVSMLNG